MSSTIKTIYNLLGINRKIPYQPLRIKYLRDVWGIEQTVIAECEGMSQSQVSKMLYQTRLVPAEDMRNLVNQITFVPDEIKALQLLPRDIIKDVPLIGFVNNVLGLNPLHVFYERFKSKNLRIAGLYHLGIQNKRLSQIFDQPHSSISMAAKRNLEKALEIEIIWRYDFYEDFEFSSFPYELEGTHITK